MFSLESQVENDQSSFGLLLDINLIIFMIMPFCIFFRAHRLDPWCNRMRMGFLSSLTMDFWIKAMWMIVLISIFNNLRQSIIWRWLLDPFIAVLLVFYISDLLELSIINNWNILKHRPVSLVSKHIIKWNPSDQLRSFLLFHHCFNPFRVCFENVFSQSQIIFFCFEKHPVRDTYRWVKIFGFVFILFVQFFLHQGVKLLESWL